MLTAGAIALAGDRLRPPVTPEPLLVSPSPSPPTDGLACETRACSMPPPTSMPPGSRQLDVSVENDTDLRWQLFVAEDEVPMGDLIGTATPAVLPANGTIRVVFTVPPGREWAIFVMLTGGMGPLIQAQQIPADASGHMPFTIYVHDGYPFVRIPAGPLPGWFDQ